MSSAASSRRAHGGSGCLRSLNRGPYLSSRMCSALQRYKYDGEDKSYLYRFVLTPMNIQLIKLVPMWAAPNFLSLVGLGVMVSAYALTYMYSPDFTRPLPSWLYLYTAIALFAYQTIDNLDGRQARRTGSSSPLGLLFDHGVDALNCSFASLTLAAVYQIGLLGPTQIFLFWCIGFVPFVFATWEEYFTGKLTLGEVNGPSDGMFLCMLFCILGWAKPGVYRSTYGAELPASLSALLPGDVASWTISTFPLILGWIGIVATVLGNAYFVSRKVSLFKGPLTLLFPFVYMGSLAWTWVLSQPAFFFLHARVFCFSMGFLFCQMICSLMVAHICDEEYKRIRLPLIPLTAAFINCVVGPALAPKVFPLVDPDVAIHCLLAINFLTWLHFVWNVILEISTLLGIRCFVLTEQQKRHPPVPSPSASPTPVTPAATPNGKHTNGATTTQQRKKSTQ